MKGKSNFSFLRDTLNNLKRFIKYKKELWFCVYAKNYLKFINSTKKT